MYSSDLIPVLRFDSHMSANWCWECDILGLQNAEWNPFSGGTTECERAGGAEVIAVVYSCFGALVYHTAGLAKCNLRTGEMFIKSGSRCELLQHDPLVTNLKPFLLLFKTSDHNYNDLFFHSFFIWPISVFIYFFHLTSCISMFQIHVHTNTKYMK